MAYRDNDMKRLWRAISTQCKRWITDNTKDTVRRLPAIVVDAENEVHYATVRLIAASGGDDQNMRMMNCCGKDLKTGDNVYVDYAYSLDNAYVSIKNDGQPWGW